MLHICVYTLMSCTHLSATASGLQLLLPRLLPLLLLPLPLRLHLLRLLRLWLLLHLRCLPRMCCRLLLVLCLLLPPLLLLVQVGYNYNGLERRTRQAKPKRRGQQKKLKRNGGQRDQIIRHTSVIGNKRQRKESEVAETQVVAADEGDGGEANGDSGGDSQGGDRQ
jgi:hypothetical protein